MKKLKLDTINMPPFYGFRNLLFIFKHETPTFSL